MEPTEIYFKYKTDLIDLFDNNVIKGFSKSLANYNALNRISYNNQNQLILWLANIEKDFSTGQWVTKEQLNHLGYRVYQNEKPSYITFHRPQMAEEVVSETTRIDKVYNVEQTSMPLLPELNLIPLGEMLETIPACVIHGKNTSHDFPVEETVVLDFSEDEKHEEKYQLDLLHELVHWTGAKERFDRQISTEEDFYEEELLAEITSGMVASMFNITPDLRHKEYLPKYKYYLKESFGIIPRIPFIACKCKTYLLSFR